LVVPHELRRCAKVTRNFWRFAHQHANCHFYEGKSDLDLDLDSLTDERRFRPAGLHMECTVLPPWGVGTRQVARQRRNFDMTHTQGQPAEAGIGSARNTCAPILSNAARLCFDMAPRGQAIPGRYQGGIVIRQTTCFVFVVKVRHPRPKTGGIPSREKRRVSRSCLSSGSGTPSRERRRGSCSCLASRSGTPRGVVISC
jgi:hypothetical protein